jgi:hypothetical protein
MLPWSLVMAAVFHDAERGPEMWIAIGLPLLVFGVYGFRYHRLKKFGTQDGLAEPDGAANGSQPIRSETNPTSSAAGSRR